MTHRIFSRLTFVAVLTLFSSLIAPALFSSASAAFVLPAPSKKFGSAVSSKLFGMHYHKLGVGSTPGSFGAVRLWDNQVRWDEVETVFGVYDFSRLDALVSAAGSSDILYVLGSTPSWAASSFGVPNYLGAPGANSMPKDLSVWRAWVTAVVSRYKGRIDSYQVWNEANFSSFFTGSSSQLVSLTKVASQVVKEIDPSAKVVTASVIVRQSKKVTKHSAAVSSKSFFYDYMSKLKKDKVKFDGVGVHLYPWASAGPGDGTVATRGEAIKDVQTVLNKLKIDTPMVDTEMSYGNRRDNGWPHKVLADRAAAGAVVGTYVQSIFSDVSQVFWYGWDSYVLGVDMTVPSGEPTLAGKAYFDVMNRLSGTRKGGCVTVKSRNAVVCSFKKDGKVFSVVYPFKGSVKPFKVKSATVCYVDSCVRSSSVDPGSGYAFIY